MKTSAKLDGFKWFVDERIQPDLELGLWNSFINALASSLDYSGQDPEPVWLMGASAFAFRIIVNRILCPSAISMFDWHTILPEAVEQAGYRCKHIVRLWGEEQIEEQRRNEAIREIIAAIDNGIAPIVWDVDVPEWGVIWGYDTNNRQFDVLGCMRKHLKLPFDKLGKREIEILSVCIPGERNNRTESEVFLKSLRRALGHYKHREWCMRPEYQDGTDAYNLWIRALEPEQEKETVFKFAPYYYAATYCSARAYARDYLRVYGERIDLPGDRTILKEAAKVFAEVTDELKHVWLAFDENKKTDENVLAKCRIALANARDAEERGFQIIEKYIGTI